MKCNKSPDADNILSELIKCDGGSMVEMLLKICNKALTGIKDTFKKVFAKPCKNVINRNYTSPAYLEKISPPEL